MSEPNCVKEEGGGGMEEESKRGISRKEKRKAMKKKKRKERRKELAEKEREEEELRVNDPEEQRRMRLMEEEESARIERERKEFEERERIWIQMMEEKKKADDDERRKVLEESTTDKVDKENDDGEDWEYIEEGPAEIIWQGNEIIVKKKKVRVPKKDVDQQARIEDADRPTSNPLPPQSDAFADYKSASVVPTQQVYENVAQQVPNFGTEQDKAHCPFHIKTGACRFGQRCSRVHFYPDKSCTILIKNMYNGPGLAWEQDEGLEYTDEEVERCYEEFYEDVHTEFLKFGEIVNFKACKNGSFHLRGNVYVHYKSLDSAVLAYQFINGRYFAGKQLTCEFVGVTRWKVAICGEYMKSRLKSCTRGTACNFIHCFRNPGGDYEWSDWDKPPPRYWVEKMSSLFGHSDESKYKNHMDGESLGHSWKSRKTLTADTNRYHSRRSRSREDCFNGGSGRSHYDVNDVQRGTDWRRHKNDDRRRSGTHDTDSDRARSDGDRGRDGERHHGCTRKSSRHQNRELEYSHDYDLQDNRTHEADSDKDRDRATKSGHTRESSRHQIKALEFLDGHRNRKRIRNNIDSDEDWPDKDKPRDGHPCHRGNSKKRSRFNDSNDDGGDSKRDWSDEDRGRNGDRHHGWTRKSSRHRNRESVLSDDSDGDGLDRDKAAKHSHTRKSSRHQNTDHGDKRNKTHDTDSDGDRTDRDKHTDRYSGQKEVLRFLDDEGDSKKRTHNNDSSDGGDNKLGWSDGDRDRDRDGDRHCHIKKSSRHGDKASDGYGNVTHESDSDGDWSDRDRVTENSWHEDSRKTTHDNANLDGDWPDRDKHKEKHRSHRGKSSRHRNKNGDSKKRSRKNDSNDDRSDKSKDRHHARTRKRSRHGSEVSEDHGEPEKREKSKHQRAKKQSHSSRRDEKKDKYESVSSDRYDGTSHPKKKEKSEYVLEETNYS